MLSVGLLGVFRVADVDNRTWSELGPAGRGLASFLFAYPSRPHRRERLADLFWPELDAERARRALNSAIWRMRKPAGKRTRKRRRTEFADDWNGDDPRARALARY